VVETKRNCSLNSVKRLAALARLRLCEPWGTWPIVVKGESRCQGRVRGLGLVEAGTTQLHSKAPSACVLYHLVIGCICGSRRDIHGSGSIRQVNDDQRGQKWPEGELASTADDEAFDGGRFVTARKLGWGECLGVSS